MVEQIFKNSLAKKLFLVSLLLANLLIIDGVSTICYGQATLSVQARNVSDNSGVPSIDFGQVNPGTKLVIPGQYIEIDYQSDQSLWFIDIYTDNTNWKGGGCQRGGLVTDDGKQRAPLMWRVYDGVQPGGVPFNATTDWAWLKDKSDLDDPDTTQYDESWVRGFNDGYVNICYGGAGYTNLADFPSKGRLANSPIYVYLGGLLGSAPDGEYSTVISFDLYHLAPMGISEYRPKERIITPAYSDGKNDVAYFSGLTGQITTIIIYDITGKKIRTIEGEPYEWDGRDDDGKIVESGVYIYQFKADVNGKQQLVSGTIAVAK